MYLHDIGVILILLALIGWAVLGIWSFWTLINATAIGAVVGFAILFIVWIMISCVTGLILLFS
jgi:hypothetical protein